MGDLSSSLGRVSDLSLTKTASNATPGTTVSFTITVTNGGPDRTTDVRVLDALPAGLTLVTATASQGVYSAAAALLPGGLGNYPAGTWRVGTLNNGANATLTISATVAAGAGSITNTAQVSYSDNADPDSTPNNSVAGEDDQASVTITRSPDLQIVKAAASTFVVNNPGGTYTLTVNNLLGSANTSGTITVTDTMPAGLTINGTPSGTNWTCTTSTLTQLTCTSTVGTVINAGTTSANPITFNVDVAAALGVIGSVNNTASVSGGSEPASNNGNNANTITTTVCMTACPDLRPNKTVGASPLIVATNSTYTLSATNVGGLTTGANAYTLIDTLPTGITLATNGAGAGWTIGAGWTCAANTPAAGDNIAGGSRVVCISSTAITVGSTSSTVVIPVVVANTAVPSVSNSVTVSGGGEPVGVQGNNTVTLTTSVTDFDLTITKTKTTAANFALGVTTDTYTIVVNNIGGRATTGTISVADTLPPGLTLTTASGGAGWAIGAGWTCTAAGSINTAGGTGVLCTSATAIAVGASSTSIVFPVTVAAAAVPSVSNTATVSNPNEASAFTGNNASTVVTPVNAPDVVISKSHAGSFFAGQTNALYTITVFNQGAQATTTATLTVTDILPAGLTFQSASGTGWTCTANLPAAGDNVVGGQRMVCTRTTAIAANSAGPPISMTVAVTAAVVPSVSNTVTMTGGGEPAGNAGNNSDTDVANVAAPPTIAKAFGASSITSGGSTTLTFTITNPAANVVNLTGINFNDVFPTSPGAMTVFNATTTNTCTGSTWQGRTGAGAFAAPAAGNTEVSLTGLTLAPGASCTVSVVVTAAVAGNYTNTSTAIAATGPTAMTGTTATAVLTVGLIVISKSFNLPAAPVNGFSQMTFTLTNPNAVAQTGANFTDTYPANLVNASPLTVGGTCTGVTTTASAGGNTFNLTAGNIPASSSCTITVLVTSSVIGSYNNTTTGVATTQTATRGPASNTATLTVAANSLSITKAQAVVCDPANFAGNGSTIFPRSLPGAYIRYTFTIANAAGAPNSVSLTSISDVLNANLNFDPDLRQGSASACATSAPTSALGRGFRMTCPAARASCAAPIFYTSASADDGMGVSGQNITITFGDGPAATPKALPTEAGYGPGELKAGETITIIFNAIVK